jgi:hypothetical protein
MAEITNRGMQAMLDGAFPPGSRVDGAIVCRACMAPRALTSLGRGAVRIEECPACGDTVYEDRAYVSEA